jgi:hypothetical protein
MGYTNYFVQNRDFTMQEWGDLRAAVINMFNRLKQVKGGNGKGRPIVDNLAILFNGDASKGEDNEPFALSRMGMGFQFCKTERKPYDRYVKAVLVLANFYAPGALTVTCDGDNEPDCWTEGVSIACIYTSRLGRSPCSPLETKRFNEQMKSIDTFKEKEREASIVNAIEKVAKLATFLDNKEMEFLANYLKANIDEVQEAYKVA